MPSQDRDSLSSGPPESGRGILKLFSKFYQSSPTTPTTYSDQALQMVDAAASTICSGGGGFLL